MGVETTLSKAMQTVPLQWPELLGPGTLSTLFPRRDRWPYRRAAGRKLVEQDWYCSLCRVGVALLLNYSMHYLGARGKIGLGYALSLSFLAGEILCERRERYRIAGRAVLGGGGSLAYFTTYALHNKPLV